MALFRCLISGILIADLYQRLAWLPDFYSDWGVLPRSVLLSSFANPWHWSVFHVSGQSPVLFAICFFGFLAYLALLLGYRTFWANLLSWIFFVSFTARNPVLAHGGDDLLRLALFWMMFLPSGAHFSLDRGLQKERIKVPVSILTVASLAFFLQLILMYFTTGLLKWHPIWASEGSALYYALQLDQFLTPVGELLRTMPFALLKGMTHSILWIELLVPLLIFIPFQNSAWRMGVVSVMTAFHFGIYLTFNLGSFPWICMAYWLAFLPSDLWDRALEKWRKRQQNVRLYYDKDCGYCLKIVNLLRTFLILPGIEVLKAQDEALTVNLMIKENSWIIRKGAGEFQTHYRAFLELLSVSPLSFLSAPLSLSPIQNAGTRLYKWQAERRPLMGSWLSRMHPAKVSTERGWIRQILAALLLILVLYWNLAVLKDDDTWEIPKPLHAAGSLLRLHQQWNMFAPYPWMEDGWMVVEGKLQSGQIWDILADSEVRFEKPRHVADRFPDVFWLKYLVNLWHRDYKDHRLHFGRYLCRRWNDGHKDPVQTFKIFYMLEVSPRPGETPEPPRKKEIWSHDCFLSETAG